ncbi:MAG: phosphoenolpyruvate carboxykinase (GTP), partial [Clostridia bacterium]|nr:phosphoenolpyruvate carboxykinase (GTP) [Clostridia bacterium]
DYFGHWLEMGKKMDPAKAPKIFHVNWFRQDDEGNFMWPGFGDNMRVLLWILDRCAGKADAVDNTIGYMPKPEDIDITDLDIDAETLKALLTVDKEVWLEDVANQKEYFAQFGDRLPKEIAEELAKLEANLKK